jgi:class 3 adenylate cyclase
MSSNGASDLIGRARGGRKLIAIVHADMVGYSRLIGLDDIGTLERLQTLRCTLIDPAIAEHGGRIVQTAGDSLLIVFDSIDGAVRCAVAIQRKIPGYDRDQPADRAIRFRIGINIGDVIADGMELHGDGVNVAARLQAECPTGGICVSRAVRDHVHARLDLAFEELGELNLKNIARTVEVFVVRFDADAIASDRSHGSTAAHPPPLPSSNMSGNPEQRYPSVITDRPPLVVLPFQNMSGDPEQEYFVDGMVEDITTALSRTRWFFVIARNTAFTYKGRSVDVRQIGAERALCARRFGTKGRRPCPNHRSAY